MIAGRLNALNRKKLGAFLLPKIREEDYTMSEKLDKLWQERDKAERHLRKAANDEKALAHEMARLTRAERTHRLCTRGAGQQHLLIFMQYGDVN